MRTDGRRMMVQRVASVVLLGVGLALAAAAAGETSTLAGQSGRLRLTVGEQWSSSPGARVRHTVTISSSLPVTDVVSLSADGGPWRVEMPRQVRVAPRQRLAVAVDSLVPLLASPDALQPITLTARSQSGESAAIRLVASTRGRLAGEGYVGCRFDYSADGVIDEADVGTLVWRFNAAPGDPQFDAAYDLDHSGRIGAADVQAVAGALGSRCATLPNADSTALREAIGAAGLRRHLEALQTIALAAGGHRAATWPGHERSADYVAAELAQAGYQVVVDPFDVESWEVLAPSVLERLHPQPRRYTDEFSTFRYSATGDVTATLHAVDLKLPPGHEANSTTSGCEAADFAGFPRGSIALIQRGGCDMPTKVHNAVRAGASAVLMFNEGQADRQGLFSGVARTDNPIPALATTFAVGEELAHLLQADPVLLHIRTTTGIVHRPTRNIIAERPVGDPGRVVLLSAHLDSVTTGPGINDNGSGCAALLEIALQMARLGIEPANRVRFGFWSAEEIGLLGSLHYVARLTPAQRAAIGLVLNFDMLGSPNYVRFVYDGTALSRTLGGNPLPIEIQAAFSNYFRPSDLVLEPFNMGGGSDHASFVAAGIPAGGLFTGTNMTKTEAQARLHGGVAGEPMDPCYHRACDTVDNINWQVLEQFADAAAHVALAYAEDQRGWWSRPVVTALESGAWPFAERGEWVWR